MADSEKKSARIIAIDARKARSPEGAHNVHTPGRYGYRLAGCGFLVGEHVLADVIIDPVIFPVPKAPEWLLGLANVQGNIVPVFDLWKFIGMQMPQRETCTVLVLHQGEVRAGLVIDGLPSPVPLGSPPVHTPPPAPALHPFLGRGLHALGGEWWEFDHQKFLARLSAVDSR